MAFIIRNYLPHEYQMVRDWGIQQGINRGFQDHIAQMVLNQNTFFIGQLDGKPIAAIAIANYGPQLSFVGYYIVRPQYRSKGYGMQIWNHALKFATASNIGLTCFHTKQPIYQKSGFKTQNNIFLHWAYGTNEIYNSPNLVSCSQVNFQRLLNYDRQNFCGQRRQFLKQWINLPSNKAYVYMKNDQIQGYGAVRPSAKGARIGPLYANSYQVAEQLLKKLLGCVQKDKLIRIQILQTNKQAMRLGQNYKFEKKQRICHMYTNGLPQMFNKQTIYGYFSLAISP